MQDSSKNILVTAQSFLKNKMLCSKLRDLCDELHIDLETAAVESPRELIEIGRRKKVMLVGGELVNREVLECCSDLKAIIKYGVGLDNIDLNACVEFDVKVLWKPGVNAPFVANFTIGLALGVFHNIFATSRLLQQSQTWQKLGGRSFEGANFGIVGCGHVGSRVGSIARSMGCNILINDILDKSAIADDLNGRQVDLETLLQNADIVSLHVPLTSETFQFIDSKKLQKMKADSVLINTARADVVEKAALLRALVAPHDQPDSIHAAAFDVFWEEPFRDAEFLALPNFFATPHIAGNSLESVLAMGGACIDFVNSIYRT